MSGKRDPFANVSKAIAGAGGAPAEAEAETKPKGRGEWVNPVPDGAPDARTSHNVHGKHAAAWAYRDAAGRVIHWVCRFDKPPVSPGEKPGKEILPQTLWRNGGRLGWHWKAAPAPRPLYGLDRLAAMPSGPTLIVEGEKTADAAAALFPAFAVASWSGGSKASGKADWAPLAGRRVVILPDADTPGREAADAVRKAVLTAGAEGAAIVQLPASLPQGWDCADSFPAGFSQPDLLAAIGAALNAASAGRLEMPGGYTLDSDGLYWHEPGRDGAEGRDVQLSGPFEILGEARDGDSNAWALIIRFRDRDGVRKVATVKQDTLAGDAGAVRRQLAEAGMRILSATGQSDRFIRFLRHVTHSARYTLAERTGWIDGTRFALPHAVISPPGAEPVHFDGAASALHYREKGTLSGWQSGLASLAPGNSRLAFALSLAFVGPIMRALELEGGGFHFRGASSLGKTALAEAAGSVWGGGGPQGFASSWRATDNALEGIAYAHSETLLILDELGQLDPDATGYAAYTLAGGQAKGRAKQDGSLRRKPEWRVMVLSTGEVALAVHISTGRRGARLMAGQELRLLDLPADAGAGMGAWETLHNIPSPAGFSDAIKAAGAAHYGHAGPAFVRGLVADPAHWESETKRLTRVFMAKATQDGDSGQIYRGAVRFGAVAAAGEMAAAMGVVPWAAGTAEAAALACFNTWAAGFGRKGLREDRQVLAKVRNAIQANQSRFANVPKDKGQSGWGDDPADGDGEASNREGEARSLSTLGYVHSPLGVGAVYLFHDAGWQEILAGFDQKAAAETLLRAGFLVQGDGGRLKYRPKAKGPRYYTVRAAILEWDEHDAGGAGGDPAPRPDAEPMPGTVIPAASDADDYDYGPGDLSDPADW